MPLPEHKRRRLIDGIQVDGDREEKGRVEAEKLKRIEVEKQLAAERALRRQAEIQLAEERRLVRALEAEIDRLRGTNALRFEQQPVARHGISQVRPS